MHVVEDQADGIIPDRQHFQELDLAFAAHRLAFLRGMSLHFRAGTANPKIFRRKLKALPVVVGDCQVAAVLVQPQLGWPRSVLRRRIHRDSVAMGCVSGTEPPEAGSLFRTKTYIR